MDVKAKRIERETQANRCTTAFLVQERSQARERSAQLSCFLALLKTVLWPWKVSNKSTQTQESHLSLASLPYKLACPERVLKTATTAITTPSPTVPSPATLRHSCGSLRTSSPGKM